MDDGLFPLAERRCGTCRQVRPIGDFYSGAEQRRTEKRRTEKRGGRALLSCRSCVRAKNQARLAPRYAILDRIKTEAGCADCGLRDVEHPEIYDFDHLPGFEKRGTVASFLTRGTIEEMLEEVAKCEVVCANCHRVRTRRLRPAASFGVDRGPQRAARDE